MWSHIIGDTVRFESRNPPLLTFTGRTKYTLSAFGEHLISEEVEAGIASASHATGASVRDWHVGPVFNGALGHHQFIVEFLRPPSDIAAFRDRLDADLCGRNADYQAHRSEGVGLPLPAILVAKPGGIDAWMRSKGKLGGQHKVPRMDGSGTLTAEIAAMLRQRRTRRAGNGRRRRLSQSGRGLLAGDEGDDLADRIQILDARLVGLDRDAEPVLEEDHELERGDRVEHAPRDERGGLGQRGGVFARQKVA